MTVSPAVFVEAPALTPIKHGLLDAATVINDPDVHATALGFEYQPEDCGSTAVTPALCVSVPAGSISGAVSTARVLTLTLTGVPAGAYPLTVNWGDGSNTSLVTSGTTATHTYAGAGTYQVYVSGGNGYAVTTTVTITPGTATGPFTGNAGQRGAAKVGVDGIPVVSSNEFAVYNLQTCRPVGQWDDAKDRAERSLLLGEGRVVEAQFAAWAFPLAVDLTPAGAAVDIADGLAILEQYAGLHYGGVPIIHMSRSAATMLVSRNVIDSDSGRLETELGSRVAAGAGYNGTPGPSAPAAGAQWLVATGMVVVRRGNVLTAGPMLGRNAGAPVNDMTTLAERPYAIAYECFVVAVEVKGTSCCTGTGVAVPQDPGSDPHIPDPPLDHGVVELQGPATWTPPTGGLRNVTIHVTNGSATIDGESLTAPNVLTFDADTGETLDPPSISLNDAGDEALISWVVRP